MTLKIILFFTIVLSVSCTESKESPDLQKKRVIPQREELKIVSLNESEKLKGQLVYVPIYSSVYNEFEGNLLHMTGILSIRNISLKEEIIIKSVDYYDTNGKLIKQFISQPFSLGKMSTKDFVIEESDLSGGTGANFLVEWTSKNKVAAPIMESVMLGSFGTKGFSFSSRGQEVEAH
ncbi:MAG: hypothetical protein CME62_13565 [Halobacteriovoraceae bacterium]|nr:hypothetical protein [Halobacteriovoraceae bacterium]|tara:strand:+ start:9139 stop:9669 length:531 start_codon:yes stop_codon:yes gene_type:complete